MPSYKEHFGGYLKQEDIQKPVRVTVESVALEDVKNDDGSKSRKLVAHFAGKSKAMVLNKTNAEAIATAAGQENYDYWGGTVLTLWADPSVKMGLKTVGGLRLVPYQQTAQRATQAPPAPPPVVEEEYDSATIPQQGQRSAAPVVTDDDIPF